MPTTNSREISALRASLRLSDRQKKILVGSLLGDGCLIVNSGGTDYRFQAEQNEAHRGYLFWLYEEFKSWIISAPKYHPKVRSWKFRTISHPELTGLAKEFYTEGKRVVPERIMKLADDPITLAVWAMDDGCRVGDRGFILNTQSFTKLDNERLRACLAINFGLAHTSLHKDKTRYRIYIQSHSLTRLHTLLAPLVHEEFVYKLPMPRRDLVLSKIG